jgi:S-adenosylmethionine uptake transporter
MPLADVVAITFSAPIFVTVMSALMLGECVGLRRWLAVMSGFVGVLLVIGPGGQIGNIAVAFAGIAALTYALSSVIARYIGPEDKPWTVTLYFTLSHLVGGLLTSLVVTALDSELYTDHPSLAFLLRPWSIGGGIDTALMGLLGINAAFGFYLLNRAYLSAPASTVAPFEYTFVLWAVLFGFVFWSEVPTTATIAGIAVLISSNLYILQRQTRNGGLRGVEGAASTPYSAEKLARA